MHSQNQVRWMPDQVIRARLPPKVSLSQPRQHRQVFVVDGNLATVFDPTVGSSRASDEQPDPGLATHIARDDTVRWNAAIDAAIGPLVPDS
jgi:hypothetical protein